MVIILVMVMLTAWMVVTDRSEAASAPVPAAVESSDALLAQLLSDHNGGLGGNIFVRYDGVDGESQDKDHDKWIDGLAMEWGASQAGAGASGQSRRRGDAVIDDLVLTFNYDKATPKLAEALLKGKVFPKLEIEFTADFGQQETYLRYELTNVFLTSYNVSGAADEGPPTVVVANNFEEIKVTYTEYDSEGNSQGNVEYSWKVEKGA
jgi:type VI secretion system secreted protein Hcp